MYSARIASTRERVEVLVMRAKEAMRDWRTWRSLALTDTGARTFVTPSACIRMRQHTSAYVSIRQHTSAYASIRQHTEFVTASTVAGLRSSWPDERAHVRASSWRYSRAAPSLSPSACIRIRQHPSAYVSIRQHPSAYAG
jgi:hypothetical protein